uniref:Uncharacterized protein n=2 Tax=unclassified Caudoviricetes TaxID=2788787 RepID=A0A8S5Q8S9_9CAUD|nr:MAG TPA: hypothetical protein [Siphoviridae sp. ctAvK3]DAE15157.1 MAG TPA: hypothetical protein [Siphoviridae sp. ctdVv30]
MQTYNERYIIDHVIKRGQTHKGERSKVTIAH